MLTALAPQLLFIVLVCLQRGISFWRLQLYFIVFLSFYILLLLIPIGASVFYEQYQAMDVAKDLPTLMAVGSLMGLEYLLAPYVIFCLCYVFFGEEFLPGAKSRFVVAVLAFVAPAALVYQYGNWTQQYIEAFLADVAT